MRRARRRTLEAVDRAAHLRPAGPRAPSPRLGGDTSAHPSLSRLVRALDEHAIVSVTDPEGVITEVNDRFCATSGFSREELVGQNHRVVSSGVHARSFFDEMWRTITRGEVWRGELCDRRKDGSLHWSSATIVPFLGADGAVVEYVAIRHDITERKAAEQALAAAKEAAERRSRAKSDLLASLSHEIRNPLHAVLGMTELALETELSPEQREYLETTQTAAEALLALLDDLVDLSKIEAGMLSIERVPLDPGELLEGVRRLMVHVAAKKGLALAIRYRGPRAVWGDPVRLRQVLVNLVGNAVKFTPRGQIDVELEVIEPADGSGAHLVGHVRDTGIGIAPERLEAIFEPFTQAERSTTRHFGGAGLGLTICRRLARLMGGELAVESAVDRGSDFHFSVPCTP